MLDELQTTTQPPSRAPSATLSTFYLQWRRLTPQETWLLLQNLSKVASTSADAAQAEAEAATRFSPGAPGDLEDTPADAFRHAYWSTLLCRDGGEQWARDFTTAHESASGGLGSAMDLHNNAQGIAIYRQATDLSNEGLSEEVLHWCYERAATADDMNTDCLVFIKSFSSATPAPPLVVNVEYVVSGGPDPNAPLYVDDVLRVFVNGHLVATREQHGRCCPPADPVRFYANPGDTLTLEAEDTSPKAWGIEAVYLQRADGVGRRQLTAGVSGQSPDVPAGVFFRQSWTLP